MAEPILSRVDPKDPIFRYWVKKAVSEGLTSGEAAFLVFDRIPPPDVNKGACHQWEEMYRDFQEALDTERYSPTPGYEEELRKWHQILALGALGPPPSPRYSLETIAQAVEAELPGHVPLIIQVWRSSCVDGKKLTTPAQASDNAGTEAPPDFDLREPKRDRGGIALVYRTAETLFKCNKVTPTAGEITAYLLNGNDKTGVVDNPKTLKDGRTIHLVGGHTLDQNRIARSLKRLKSNDR